MKQRTCRTCLMEHDEEIHAATERVREWFREEVMLSLYEPADFLYPPAEEPEIEMAS